MRLLPMEPRQRIGAILALALLTPQPAAADPARMSGVLETPQGVSPAGYRLRFESGKGIAVETLPLAGDGRFVLSAIPPGRYEVRLLTFDGRMCRVDFPAVEVGEDPETVLRLHLDREPACGAPRHEHQGRARGRRRWLIGAGVLGAAVVAVALSGGDGAEPAVSPSAP